MQGGADALLGLCAGDDEPTDAALGEPLLEVGLLERVRVLLVDQRLGLVAGQLETMAPTDLFRTVAMITGGVGFLALVMSPVFKKMTGGAN